MPTEEQLDALAAALIPRLEALGEWGRPDRELPVRMTGLRCESCGRRMAAHSLTDACFREAS